MIQDGFDYGDGYEKATEPGPDVQVLLKDFLHGGLGWHKRSEYMRTEPLDGVSKYRKPIKPKDEKMEKKTVIVNVIGWPSPGHVELTLAEAEKAGEEAKRIKAEIAKREEIGPGNWVLYNCQLMRATRVTECGMVYVNGGYQYPLRGLTKLHPPPEVRAWLDKTIGGEG
jgi:hypothetical protein